MIPFGPGFDLWHVLRFALDINQLLFLGFLLSSSVHHRLCLIEFISCFFVVLSSPWSFSLFRFLSRYRLYYRWGPQFVHIRLITVAIFELLILFLDNYLDNLVALQSYYVRLFTLHSYNLTVLEDLSSCWNFPRPSTIIGGSRIPILS